MPQFITIEEQGLRDGLQTLPITFSTATKLKWIDRLIQAGLKRIQVASFVNPKLVPQMANATELVQQLPQRSDVVFSALVLNVKGVQRAIDAGIKHLSISLSASNTHSLKNANKTIAQAKDEFKEMVALALQHGIKIRGGIQCAFGCRYEGKIEEAVVYELVEHHLKTGVHELALADSTGMGNPIQVNAIMNGVVNMASSTPTALHLHNTENKGYANVVAAIQAGVTMFDTAFGGLGGCPFIKGATGNIATEDTVHLLHQMGFETNVSIKNVAEVSNEMESILNKEVIGVPNALPSLMYKMIFNNDIKII